MNKNSKEKADIEITEDEIELGISQSSSEDDNFSNVIPCEGTNDDILEAEDNIAEESVLPVLEKTTEESALPESSEDTTEDKNILSESAEDIVDEKNTLQELDEGITEEENTLSNLDEDILADEPDDIDNKLYSYVSAMANSERISLSKKRSVDHADEENVENSIIQNNEEIDNVDENNNEEKKDSSSIVADGISVIDDKDNFSYNYKKRNKAPIVIAIIIVVLLVLLGVFYKFFLLTPRNIFLKSLNSEYKLLSNYFDSIKSDKYYNIMKSDVIGLSTNTNMNINVNESLLDDNSKKLIQNINNLKINYDYIIDKKNKQLDANIGLTSGESNLIANIYGRNNKLYLQLQDIFDKYMYLDIEDYDSVFETNDVDVSEVEYIVEKFKNEFLLNLNKEKFTKEQTTINIDKEEIKANKISYELTNSEIIKLFNDTFNNLSKDEKFVSILSELISEDKDKTKKYLQELVSDADTADDKSSIKFNIYTTGLLEKPVKYEALIISENSITDELDTFTISYIKNKNDKIFEFINNSEILFTITINNNSDIVIDSTGFKANINITSKNNETIIKYEFVYDTEENITCTGEIKLSEKEVNANEEYNNKILFKYSISSNNENLGSIDFNFDYNIKANPKISSIDLSNSVNYEELTEDEMLTIQNNLISNDLISNYIELINSLLVPPDDEMLTY